MHKCTCLQGKSWKNNSLHYQNQNNCVATNIFEQPPTLTKMLWHFRCWRTWCLQYPTSQEFLASCTTSLPSRLEQQNGNNSSENSALETPSFLSGSLETLPLGNPFLHVDIYFSKRNQFGGSWIFNILCVFHFFDDGAYPVWRSRKWQYWYRYAEQKGRILFWDIIACLLGNDDEESAEDLFLLLLCPFAHNWETVPPFWCLHVKFLWIEFHGSIVPPQAYMRMKSFVVFWLCVRSLVSGVAGHMLARATFVWDFLKMSRLAKTTRWESGIKMSELAFAVVRLVLLPTCLRRGTGGDGGTKQYGWGGVGWRPIPNAKLSLPEWLVR